MEAAPIVLGAEAADTSLMLQLIKPLAAVMLIGRQCLQIALARHDVQRRGQKVLGSPV